MTMYETKLKIKIPFEYCDECIYLKIEQKPTIQDEKEVKWEYVCRNENVCVNAVKTWNKGKRKARE